jgi:hypothetical protein
MSSADGGTAGRAESPRQPGPVGSRGPRRWWVWVAGAAVLVLLVGVVAWAPWGGDRESAAPTPTLTVTSSTPTSTTVTSTTSAPSTTAPQPLTLEGLAADLVDVVPASLAAYAGRPVAAWGCDKGPYVAGETEAPLPTTGPLPAGSVAACRPSPVPAEGEHPVVTVLVLDDLGTHVAALSGNRFPLLNPVVLPDGTFAPVVDVPPGQNCTRLLAPDSSFVREAEREQLTQEQTYVGVVLYYFLQNRSRLLDADDNGIPCETLVPESVVSTVWGGGWVPPPQ